MPRPFASIAEVRPSGLNTATPLSQVPLPRTAPWERVVVLVVSVVAFGILLWTARGFWFYVDDWNFLLLRDGGSVDGLLRPHVNHWQTTQVIWYRTAYRLWGLNSYLPLAAAAIAMHVAAAASIWWALRRLGVRPWIAIGTFVLLVGFGNGGSDFAQGLFFGSGLGRLCFGLVIGIIALPTSPRLRLSASALLVLAVMSSGLSTNVVIALAIAIVLTARLRELWWVPLPGLIAIAAWFSTYGKSGVAAQAGSTAGNMLEGLQTALLTTPLRFSEGLLGLGAVAGAVVAAALVVALIVRLSSWSITTSEWVGILAAGGFLIQLGVVRFAEGAGFLAQAGTPRYLYVLAFLLVPFIAVSLERTLQRFDHRSIIIAAAVVLGIAIGSNLIAIFPAFAEHTSRSAEIRRSVASAAVMLKSDPIYVPWTPSSPRWADPLPLSRVASEVAAGWRIENGGEWSNDFLVSQFEAESRLMIGRHYPWHRPRVGVVGVSSPDGCINLIDRRDLDVAQSGDGWLEGPPGTQLTLKLIDGRFTDTDAITITPPQTRVGYAVDPTNGGAVLIASGDLDEVRFCGIPKDLGD